MPEQPTGIVTFLFTDIEGSTRLWEDKPDAMRESLARHNRIMQTVIEAHNGFVFKTIGDSFQAAFAQASDAVAAALEAQLGLAHAEWGATGPLRVRMGIHVGAAEAQGNDYATTPTLNRVARLMTAGHGGQILLSQPAVEMLNRALPPGADLRDLGWHRLKDLARAEQIFQLTHPELRAEFPPLRSVDSFPNNLPSQLNSFVGRAREIAQVKNLLDAPARRLVTLVGPGGSGKTRLAIQVAGELIEHFHDGVWLIELAALTDPAFIIPRIATVLGVREERGQELIDAVCEYCKSLHLLIVLDNCEHLITATAQVAETLLQEANDLKILATSQEILRVPGESVFAVPPLSLPTMHSQSDQAHLQDYEAIRLFVERANSSNPGFSLNEHNAPLVVQVSQRLDGIPLALELAASRLRVLTIEQIATRLDDRFRLLTAGSRTAMPRHQTLRATMDWSYDLCSDKERIVWRRSAVFASGFALEAAEAVVSDTQIPTAQVLDLLIALVERSLIVTDESAGEVRYRLLSTIQQYGRERLVESGEIPALRDKHRDYFVALAERAEPQIRLPNQVRWLDRLDAELDNFRVAIEWSLENDQGQSVLRICGALANFWLLRAHLTEGQTWVARALPLTATRNAIRAKALNAAGNLAYTRGDYSVALNSYREGLDIYRELQDEIGMAKVLNNLGNIVSLQGDYPRAKDYYEEALILQRGVKNTSLVAILLGNLGSVFVELGDLEQARNLFSQALAVNRELGDRWGMGNMYNTLGQVAEYQNDYARARDFYLKGLALRRELKDNLGIAIATMSVGHIAMHKKDFVQAHKELRASLVALRELGDQQVVTQALKNIAELWVQEQSVPSQTQYERATRLLGAVQALREALGAPLTPALRAEFESCLTACRAGLRELEFQIAWEEGRTLTMEQAIQLALS